MRLTCRGRDRGQGRGWVWPRGPRPPRGGWTPRGCGHCRGRCRSSRRRPCHTTGRTGCCSPRRGWPGVSSSPVSARPGPGHCITCRLNVTINHRQGGGPSVCLSFLSGYKLLTVALGHNGQPAVSGVWAGLS